MASRDDLYAGLSGLELAEQEFDLGEGVFLRKTYSHLFAPFMLAFSQPEPGKHHPGPWRATQGGIAFDITSELYVPAAIAGGVESVLPVAKTILFLLRLGVNPATRLPVLANAPFISIPNLNDGEIALQPFEVEPRYFPLDVVGGVATAEAADWIRQRWQLAHKLVTQNAAVSLAVEALDKGQFVQHSALTLVSLWGALEALFSPSNSELSFRVSSLIAAYLELPGPARATRQKAIAKLYQKRSAAAHGKPTHDSSHILQSFNLLREVLLKLLDEGRTPTMDELELRLFGA